MRLTETFFQVTQMSPNSEFQFPACAVSANFADSNLPISDWLTHQHRDTCASIIGHPALLSYVAIADGESLGRARFELTEVRRPASLPTHSPLLIVPLLCYLENASTLRA